MQTFLPYPDFTRSAQALDDRRLGKQRSEALILLRALLDPGRGYARHPACLMWHGRAHALYLYGACICVEYRRRGFKDAVLESLYQLRGLPQEGAVWSPWVMPRWLGDLDFHDCHKARLLAKDPQFYSKYNWNVDPDWPYLWPILDDSPQGYHFELR